MINVPSIKGKKDPQKVTFLALLGVEMCVEIGGLMWGTPHVRPPICAVVVQKFSTSVVMTANVCH